MDKRTGLFANGIIWFGVAISVSEIEAGIEIGAAAARDSLWLPLVLGHIFGGILLFFVGLIGARVRLNAMETTKSSFGKYGSKFFAALNTFQLLAWVAVLNAQGASALAGLNLPISFPLTCVILAALIAAWVYVGIRRSANVTTVVMAALAVLLAILSVKLFGLDSSPAGAAGNTATALKFWNIFEISIAMPISWLPVISDYTKDAEKPVKATAISAIAYTFASLWMYIIGIEISGIGASNNIAQAILLAGLGIPGIIIVVLSTVTTNFLAANSAGESSKAIYSKINPKIAGVVVSFDRFRVRPDGCRSLGLVLLFQGTYRIARRLALEHFRLARRFYRLPGRRTFRFRFPRPHAPCSYRFGSICIRARTLGKERFLIFSSPCLKRKSR